MSAATGRLIFVFVLVVNCILWSRSRYGQPMQASLLHGEASLVKRISFELSQPQGTQVYDGYSGHECRPLAFPTASQCQHVEADCPSPDTTLDIDYLRRYFCTELRLRPLVFVGLIIWLIFLFSTLGISASDFFTPNLATIAQLLGLDENVAGVTFLAFGNGSPDVFSTFSAMRADSGSLAIGELLGAATFIVSCVVGSMCIIKPFKVHRGPFLRDVGFFAVAVILMLCTLWDGKISSWEAGTLVGMYVGYVLVVVFASWWDRRQERKRHMVALIRDEYAEEPVFQPYTDAPLPSLAVTPASPSRLRAISAPNPPRLQTNIAPARPYSRSPSPSSSHVTQLPSFSLIGALEFREVVASLKNQAAGTSLGFFETPITPYAGGHYHIHSRSVSRTPHSSLQSSMDEETLNGLQLDERLHPHAHGVSPFTSGPLNDEPRGSPSDYFGHLPSHDPPPSIYRTPASPSTTVSEASSEEQLYAPPTKRQRVYHCIGRVFHTLFPTLHHFREQSPLTQLACLLAAPAVLCLTLTLPVVVTPYENSHSSREKTHHADGRLVDFEEEGIERVLIAEEEVSENIHELSFNKWLMAAQCVFGPLFCVWVLFGGSRHQMWLLLAAGIGGSAIGTLVTIFAEKANSPTARMTRCSMGFFVSIVWIMAIADEVVNVLQTFGLIFGLSDAIIGLTIFAMGNSLADLVANMSVAAFAPIMGFSACFGGPMLNILLGVGISGSYIISQTSQPYFLKLSTTLFVSAFGLLFLLAATLIFVPLNDYFLTRRWGMLLIATYTVIMVVNVIVELKSER
ncbi:Sodium/calcium exchanger protein-domain-containing protein [Crassisporium funariophilum]|nr:Sodium/calcium exchanger protein-domain-containing protein [Crassisporium funariophilum]